MSPEATAHMPKTTKLYQLWLVGEEPSIELGDFAAEYSDSDSDDDIILAVKASLKCSKCKLTLGNIGSRKDHERNSQLEHCQLGRIIVLTF